MRKVIARVHGLSRGWTAPTALPPTAMRGVRGVRGVVVGGACRAVCGLVVMLAPMVVGLGGCASSETRSGVTVESRGGAGPLAVGPAPFVARGPTAVGAGVPANAVVARGPWTFEEQAGEAIHTRSYSIYTTEKSPIITDRLPGFMEAAVDAYTSLITGLPRPTARMETFVMGSRPQWQRLTLYMMGERGKNLTWIERGGFAFGGRAFLFDIGAADTMSIASHEGWHQFTQRTFQEPLPVWLEEGIASYFEGHRWAGNDVTFMPWFNIERFDRLREAAARGQLLGFDEVLRMTPDRLVTYPNEFAITYYAQLWALVHFLVEGDGGRYRPGLQTLLADAASGRMGQRLAKATGGRAGMVLMGQRLTPVLVREYFGLEISELSERYGLFMRQLVVPGTRNAIVAGRSPITPEAAAGVWNSSGSGSGR